MAAARVSAGEVTPAPVYEIQSVAMEYRSRAEGVSVVTEALNNVSLQIEPRARVVVVGRSGSGKSSLLQLLAGLDKPKKGKIVCRPGEETFELNKLNEDERARFRMKHVGFLYQAFHLLPALTAWENIAVPLVFAGMPPADRKERAHALLRNLKMIELAMRYPYELSGGQQQRVAIARALANDPAVLLADEPTGNLDSRTAAEVLDLIKQQHEARSLTVVLVTHDSAVCAFGSQTIELQDGAIAGRGQA